MQYINSTFTVLQASPGSCLSCLAKMRHQKSAGSHCLGKHQICQIFLWQIFFKITWPLKRSSELSVSFLDPGTQFKIYIKIQRSFSKEIISFIYKFSFLKAFFLKECIESIVYTIPLIMPCLWHGAWPAGWWTARSHWSCTGTGAGSGVSRTSAAGHWTSSAAGSSLRSGQGYWSPSPTEPAAKREWSQTHRAPARALIHWKSIWDTNRQELALWRSLSGSVSDSYPRWRNCLEIILNYKRLCLCLSK